MSPSEDDPTIRLATTSGMTIIVSARINAVPKGSRAVRKETTGSKPKRFDPAPTTMPPTSPMRIFVYNCMTERVDRTSESAGSRQTIGPIKRDDWSRRREPACPDCPRYDCLERTYESYNRTSARGIEAKRLVLRGSA